MNIHQLLSVSQNSPQTQSQALSANKTQLRAYFIKRCCKRLALSDYQRLLSVKLLLLIRRDRKLS